MEDLLEVAAWIGRCRAVGEAEQQLVNVQTRPKQDQTENFLQFLPNFIFKGLYFTLEIFRKSIPQMAISISLGGVDMPGKLKSIWAFVFLKIVKICFTLWKFCQIRPDLRQCNSVISQSMIIANIKNVYKAL